MTIFTTIPNDKKEAEYGPDAQLLVSSKDVEAGAVDPVTVRTLHASRQQMISMLERRRRRLRCVLILTSLMTIGTAALAVFYLAQFLYTYSRALHYQGMCQYSFEEPSETQNEAGRLYGRKEAQIALAGAGRQPMDVELRAGQRQFPPVGSNSRLIGRPDGHEGYFIPHLEIEESDEFPDEFDVENGDVEKKHHHKKKTTTKKPSAEQMHGGRQVVQERVDIVDPLHVRLEVPQMQTLTSASVLHDFNSQWTAFLDDDGQRCFVKPLAKSMASPPRSLMDLLVKLSTDYYTPNVQAIRVQYRILPNPKTPEEMRRFGPFILNTCQNVSTYEMIPIIPNANARRRRSVDSKRIELNFGLAGGEGAPIVEIADIQFN